MCRIKGFRTSSNYKKAHIRELIRYPHTVGGLVILNVLGQTYSQTGIKERGVIVIGNIEELNVLL